MKRSDFLKILGVSILTPNVLIPNGGNIAAKVPLNKFNPKRWPIYPDKIDFSVKEGDRIRRTLFSYVKINRNETDYLVPVREIGIDNSEQAEERFEYNVSQTNLHFQVGERDDFFIERGLLFRYDPNIHKD